MSNNLNTRLEKARKLQAMDGVVEMYEYITDESTTVQYTKMRKDNSLVYTFIIEEEYDAGSSND